MNTLTVPHMMLINPRLTVSPLFFDIHSGGATVHHRDGGEHVEGDADPRFGTRTRSSDARDRDGCCAPPSIG